MRDIEYLSESDYTEIDPAELERLMGEIYQVIVLLEGLQERVHKVRQSAQKTNRLKCAERARVILEQIKTGKHWADIAFQPLEEMMNALEKEEEGAFCKIDIWESLKRGCNSLKGMASLIELAVREIEQE